MDSSSEPVPLSDSLASALFAIDAEWMIEPTIGYQLWSALTSADRRVHEVEFAASPTMDAAMSYFRSFGQTDAKEPGAPEEPFAERFSRLMQGDLAVFDIRGPMTKSPVSMSGGTSTAYLRRLVDLAARDNSVKGIMLRVDSPGGAVAGTADLAESIHQAGLRKPVYGFAEDLAASAGYWALAACTKCYATPTTQIGSIGTYMSIPDLSRMAAMRGVDSIVIASDGATTHKGAGVPGTPITDVQKAEFRKRVNALNAHFTGFVARKRGFDSATMAHLADGRVHMAADALQLGLIDGIASFDSALGDLSRATKTFKPPRGPKEQTRMADEIEQSENTILGALTKFFGGSHRPQAQEPHMQPFIFNPGGQPAAEFKPSVEANSLLAACMGLGINNAASLHTMSAEASDGRELKTTLISECEAQAIRALGADQAKVAMSGVEHLPVATIVQKRDAFRTHANTTMEIDPKTGASRKSAAGPLQEPRSAANAEGDPPPSDEATYREAGRAGAAKLNGPQK